MLIKVSRCALPTGTGYINTILLTAVFVLATLAGAAIAFDPIAGDFTRDDPLDIRIVSYNHNRNFIEDSNTDAEFERILTTLDPDIICFQEFTSSVSQAEIAARLDSIIPLSGNWQIHFGLLGGIRTVIASRYTLSMTRVDTIPTSATRGVTIALADLPDSDYSQDIYLMGVHLKCCGNPGGSEDASRQDSADAIANWMGDARGVVRPSGNNISLPDDTPMIALGDFNLVGGPQPEDTLVTGDIQDEGQYGPDVQGDWDVSDLTDLTPVDPFTGDSFTWQGNNNFPPGRLDRFFYTDSAVAIANSFILNTDTMTGTALAAAGLQSGDTLPENTSDHLPLAMDVRFSATPDCMIDADCSDGMFCNGMESCVAGNCMAGTPVDCNDGIVCTVDSCNETNDNCDNSPDNGACDDAAFCNGSETCNTLTGCQAGTPVDCNDGIVCTVDSCNETNDSCDNTPDNGACDDGAFCNGAETCDQITGCQQGSDPCVRARCNEDADACVDCLVDIDCDDGQFCNGMEFCEDATGVCMPGNAVDCDDEVECTIDTCDEANDDCTHTPEGACDDGLFCNGAESCDILSGCAAGTNPCAPPLLCDEANQQCTHCLVDFDCNDSDACTDDSCQGGECSNVANYDLVVSCCDPQTGILVDINDDDPCTADLCDAMTGAVSHPARNPDVCAFAVGGRYIAVIPTTSPELEIAIMLTHSLGVKEGACLEQFVQADGSLGDVPFFQPAVEWETIDTFGIGIVPEAEYEVFIDDGESLSLPFAVTTSLFGDVDRNGVINLADVQFAVLVFQVAVEYDPAADLKPCHPNQTVNFEDIFAAVQGFQGFAFEQTKCPTACR